MGKTKPGYSVGGTHYGQCGSGCFFVACHCPCNNISVLPGEIGRRTGERLTEVAG